jgi:hypothetical protein
MLIPRAFAPKPDKAIFQSMSHCIIVSSASRRGSKHDYNHRPGDILSLLEAARNRFACKINRG